jgi:Zinc carboxypeptidase
MDYSALHMLDVSIQQLQVGGAAVATIGVTPGGLPLRRIQIGSDTAPIHVLLIAGLHANEIIGPLAAVAWLHHLLGAPISQICMHCIPVADPDGLRRNQQALPAKPELRDVLRLTDFRDLEGEFATDLHPECAMIRAWLHTRPQVDCYVALHTAQRIAPGLFFYFDTATQPDAVDCITQHLLPFVPASIPFATHDPTGLATAVVRDGMFLLPPHDPAGTIGGSLAYVYHQFRPRLITVTETPLGICPSLALAPLEAIEQYNRAYATSGTTVAPFLAIPASLQVQLTMRFVEAVCRCIVPTEHASSAAGG